MNRPVLSVICLSFVTLLACSSESATPTPVAAETSGAGETAPAAEAEAGAPKIACADSVYDFGAVSPADKIEHVFTIKNEGTAELKIERIQKT